MLVVSGKVRVRSESREAAIQAGRTMTTSTLAEPGCQEYAFCFDIDDPLVVRIHEEWTSQEALDAHLTTPHFQEFATLLPRYLDGHWRSTRFEIASAGPLFG